MPSRRCSARIRRHLRAQLGIEIGQRLVEQQDLRLEHQRACEGDALLLAAARARRRPVAKPLISTSSSARATFSLDLGGGRGGGSRSG